MKHYYTTPTLLEEKIEFERGFELSIEVDEWGDGGDYSGSAD